MYCYSLRFQSHLSPNNPIFFNAISQNPHFSPKISNTSPSISSSSNKNPHFILKISHHPQKSVVIVSGERKNHNRRNQWRRLEKTVTKCASLAWNLRFLIASEPLDLILDSGGWGGGLGFRRKKGFGGWGGGFERKWEFGVIGFLVLVSVFLLIWGRCRERELGFRVLVLAVLGSWIRVWRKRWKWGLEVLCCGFGVLVLMEGLWREERLERVFEGFLARFPVLEMGLKRKRRRRRRRM